MPEENWEYEYGIIGAPVTLETLEASQEATQQLQEETISIWNSIRSAVFGIANTLSSIFDTVKSVIGAIAVAIISVAKSVYAGLVTIAGAIHSALSWLWDRIKEGFSIIWRWFKGAFDWIRDKIMDFIYAIVRTIMDWYNIAKDKLGQFADSIHDKIESAISSVALGARNKLIDMTVATMTIKGMWSAFDHFKAGDYKKAFITGLFSPLMGAFAGAIIDAVIPKPETLEISLMPKAVIPDRETYEQFDISNIPKYDFEVPLALQAHAKVDIVKPLQLSLEAPIVVGDGMRATVRTTRTVEEKLSAGIYLDVDVAIRKSRNDIINESSPLIIGADVWITFESGGGYYTYGY